MSFNVSNIAPDLLLGGITSGEEFLIFSQNVAEIVQLKGVIDEYPDESHDLSVKKSTFPIETGASLTDHAVVEPAKLVLSAYVTSISTYFGSVLVGQKKDVEAWQKIELKMQRIELLTVVTLLKTYDNMLITDITTDKNADTPKGNLIARITLEEVLLANTQETKLPQTNVKGAAENKPSTVNQGDKQSPSATQAVASSILSKLIS